MPASAPCELSILLVGPTDRGEFRDAPSVLAPYGRITAVDDIEAGYQAITEGRVFPDLLVFAQAFPGRFPIAAVERLRGLAPLARVIVLLGSWCEGEVRSGHPWPAALRVYWHQWRARSARECASLQGGLVSNWALPTTTTEEEHFLALPGWSFLAKEGAFPPALGSPDCPQELAEFGPLAAAGVVPPRQDAIVIIWSPQWEMQDWLSTVCRRAGYVPRWLLPGEELHGERPRAIVFDATNCLGEELDELRRLTMAHLPIIVLMDFPRQEDQIRVRAAGASGLLAKPILLEDLLWCLGEMGT